MFLSATTVLLTDTRPAKAADEFLFSGSIEATIPTIDGKTQYGPVLITLTDITSQTAKDISLQKVTPPVPLPGYDYSIAKIQFTNISINKNDTYQICIKGTDLCTHKIGPSEQMYNSYVVKDKGVVIGIYDIISVSKQYIIDNPSVIPITAAPTTTTTTASTCDIPGVGWIICPVVRFMANVADSAFGFLSDNFLNTSPSILNTDASAKNADGTLVGTTTYQAWQIIRNIANVAFVIAFLIIIFSQVTNFGITNYGVKKMLPRLIIAAVLVNISFFVCQIAVDLSNIIGYSLESLLAGLAPVSTNTGGTFSGNSWTNYAGGALVLGATGAIAWASLAALIPAVIAAIVALVMILFILIGRQAIIILLVVISPLAFVAFILPNTEKLFKTWQKTATSMLLLFPIVAAVFGVSKLASTILSSVFSANNNTIGGIAAAAVMVLPLFVVPSLLKKSLDGVGSIGTKLNSLASRAGSGLGKSASNNTRLGQFAKYNDEERNRRRALIQSGNYVGSNKNPFNWSRNIGNRMNRAANSTILGNFGARSAASGYAMADKIEDERVDNAVKLYKAQKGPEYGPEEVAGDYVKAVQSGNAIQALALQRVLRTSGAKGIDNLHNSLETLEASGQFTKNPGLRKSIKGDILSAGIKGKDAALDFWSHASPDKTLSRLSSGDLAMGVFGSLNELELSGQTNSVLDRATEGSSSFKITAEIADSILTNPTTSANLGRSGTRAKFEAKRTPPAPIPQPIPAPTPQPAPNQPSGLLDQYGNPLPPSQNNNP